jgi:hypothetical protein
MPLHECIGWHWSMGTRTPRGWAFSTSQWHSMLPETQFNVSQSNARWACSWSLMDWQQLWKKLWGGRNHPRIKFLIWRVLSHGFYTNVRGAIWQVSNSTCEICQNADETISHLFFECNAVQQRWLQFLIMFNGTSLQFGPVQRPIDILNHAITNQDHSPGKLIVTSELLWWTWRERNA